MNSSLHHFRMLTLEKRLELMSKRTLSITIKPEVRHLIGVYQEREGIRTESEATRQILAAGLIAAEVFPD